MTETDHEPKGSGSFLADESKGIDVIISTCMRKIVAQLRLRLLHFWQTTGILSMTTESWSLARLVNTILIINSWAISF